MMKKTISATISAAAVAWALVPAVAQAQSASEASDQVAAEEAETADGGDIVVTARKRSESAQDVPISISVIGGERLQELNLSSIQSLQQVTAGLTIRTTPKNYVNLTLRGLGTGPAVDVFEQSVAAFVDGTYAGRAPEFNAALFDFERVEVIRGGQASLLSKNTSLGAISLTTRKPGSDFGFNMSATHDFELGSNSIEAGMDIPVTDTLSIRAAGRFNDQHGWIYNRIYDDRVPRTKSYAGRITAVYSPVDALEVTLAYTRYKNNANGLSMEYFSDPTGQARSLAELAGDTSFELMPDRRTSRSSTLGNDYDRTVGDRVIGTINYEIGDYTLTSVTSYSDFDEDRYFDADQLAGNYADGIYYTGNRQWQQELRLTSPADGRPLDYVVGASFFHEKWRFREDITSQCVGCTPAQLAAFPLRGGYIGTDDQTTRDLAAFAQVNYRLTDTLGISAGVRYTNERRSATFERSTTRPGALTAVLFQPMAPTTLRRREDNVDGSIGLNYKPNSDLLIYASISRGTKSGGFINAPTNVTTPTGAAAAEYGSEKATTYEIGGKLSFANGGRLNLALFNTDIDNFQQSVFINPNFVTTSRDLYSRGAELQAAYEMVPGLRLEGSVTYADTARKNEGGLRVQGAPKWSGNATLQLRQPLNGDLTLSADIGTEFRSAIFLTDEEQTIGFAPGRVVPKGQGYAYLNGRIGLRSGDGWELAIIGKNLTNRYVFEYSAPAPFIGNAAYVNPNIPRTVAVQLNFNY